MRLNEIAFRNILTDFIMKSDKNGGLLRRVFRNELVARNQVVIDYTDRHNMLPQTIKEWQDLLDNEHELWPNDKWMLEFLRTLFEQIHKINDRKPTKLNFMDSSEENHEIYNLFKTAIDLKDEKGIQNCVSYIKKLRGPLGKHFDNNLSKLREIEEAIKKPEFDMWELLNTLSDSTYTYDDLREFLKSAHLAEALSSDLYITLIGKVNGLEGEKIAVTVAFEIIVGELP